MNGKLQAGVIGLLITVIGAFGVVETLQAAPDSSQRLRGMEGRAFLVEARALAGPPANPGSYCYIFNSEAEWIDERFPVPGTWEQQSVGAATSYTATASVEFPGFGLVEVIQDGHVTPAGGKGVLQLEAVTEVFIEAFGLDPFQILATVGYEIDIDDCPSSLPPGD